MLAMGTCSITHWVGGESPLTLALCEQQSVTSQLCAVAEHSLSPGTLRCHLSSAHLRPVGPFPASGAPWGLHCPLQSHADPHPAHCTVTSSSTGTVPTSSSQCPQPVLGRARGSGWLWGPWHGRSCLPLVYEGWESIGVVQPFPVLSGQRRGRGGAGQTVTLPSLLTSSSPCNLALF